MTHSATIGVRTVLYTAPSRLIGCCLKVHIYHDRLVCYFGTTPVLTVDRRHFKHHGWAARPRAGGVCAGPRPRRLRPAADPPQRGRMTDVGAAKLPVMLTTLRLPTISRTWQEFGGRVDREGWGSARFLAALCGHEQADLQGRAGSRCIRPSPDCLRTVSPPSVDFAAVPTVRKGARDGPGRRGRLLGQCANVLLYYSAPAGRAGARPRRDRRTSARPAPKCGDDRA